MLLHKVWNRSNFWANNSTTFLLFRYRRSVAQHMLDPSAKLFQHCWNHSLAKMAVEFKFTKPYGSYPSHNAMIIVACARLSVCEDERKDEKRARERASGKQREGWGGEPVSIFLNTLIRPLPRPPRVNMSNVKMCKEEFARVRRLNFFLFYFFILPAFLDTGLLRGIRQERDS